MNIKTLLNNITPETLAEVFPASAKIDPQDPLLLPKVANTLVLIADTIRPCIGDVAENGTRKRNGEITQRRLLAIDYLIEAVQELQTTAVTTTVTKALATAIDKLTGDFQELYGKVVAAETQNVALRVYITDLATRLDALERNGASRITMPTAELEPEPAPPVAPIKPLDAVIPTIAATNDAAKDPRGANARVKAEELRKKRALQEQAVQEQPAPEPASEQDVTPAQAAVAQAMALDFDAVGEL
jgi:hypothetical protein